MNARIEPGKISGSLAAPPSKSMTQRVFAGALLHSGKTVIKNAGTSNDETAALHIIQSLGAKVQHYDDVIEVTGGDVHPINGSIHCGESGLSARLFTLIAGLSGSPVTITGKGSLLQRPMKVLEEVLPQLGITVSATNGCLPITLSGEFTPADITIDGSDSSQFLSGLLFAYCYADEGKAHTIEVHDLKSRPYIDMTLHVLRQFGCEVKHDGYKKFYPAPASAGTAGRDLTITIDGDWSSAAYFLVAGAIAGNVSVSGLADNHIQADNAIFPLLKSIGADVQITGDTITVKKAPLSKFEFDDTDSPDLFPVLAILAACCNGESYIKGVHRLFHKESNRAQSISEMLMDFDVPFSIEDDTLCITGVDRLQGTVIDAHHDHRIAMVAAIGALRANGPVDIPGAEAVNKSYPDFFKHLSLCGGKCILT